MDYDILLSEYRIRKIMGRYGTFPETRRKYRPAGSRQSSIHSPDQIKQEFHADKPGKLLAGDITYIRTKLGWVYLASVIDLFNREVIGYSISQNMDGELVKRALGNAIGRKGSLRGTIFHSDRGSKYGSGTFKRMLNQHGIIQSMSRGGCPYDNACSESFFATAKKECIYRKEYDTLEEIKQDLFEYIELFYNRKRLHSYLGYMSPVEYRQRYEAKNALPI